MKPKHIEDAFREGFDAARWGKLGMSENEAWSMSDARAAMNALSCPRHKTAAKIARAALHAEPFAASAPAPLSRAGHVHEWDTDCRGSEPFCRLCGVYAATDEF